MFFHDRKEHGMKNLFQYIMKEMSVFSHDFSEITWKCINLELYGVIEVIGGCFSGFDRHKLV